jgi:hypothetical protein
MKIIGLIGPKGSGKDTSFELLEELKLADGKISFAGPLKTICSKVFGMAPVMFHDVVFKEKELKKPITLTLKHIRAIRDLCEEYVPSVTDNNWIKWNPNAVSTVGLEGRVFKTPRELLQVIGTDLIRDRVYGKFHMEAAFSPEATKRLKKNGTYCVTDVRFLNEHEFLTSKFGASYKAFYVDRPEASAKLAEAVASGSAHQSETETQAIRELLKDSIIDNSGTLADLKKLLKTLDLGSKVKDTPESKFRYVSRQDADE